MVTAIVTTDSVFGPWVIPSRGQNMIMNHYAHSHGIKVDAVIPEPLFSNQLLTTRWSKKNKNLSDIILCSIHQLPQDEFIIGDFLDDMQDVKIHFVLENLSGIGRGFLLDKIHEAAIFQQSEVINYKEANSYKALFQIMRDKGTDQGHLNR